MNIKQLEAFLLVAQLKSFTKAAAQLMMSQPAVSFQIKALEEDLQVSLFERNDKRVVLTEAGRILYPEALQLVRQYYRIKTALSEINELKTGHLIIGANSIAGECLLPSLIGSFRERYPGIKVSLLVGNSSQVAKWLQEREADMGILSVSIQADGIECQPWIRDRMVIITPPHHPRSGSAVLLTDLTGEFFIIREAGSGSRRVVEQLLASRGVNLEQFAGLLEVGSTQALVNAVRVGLGIGAVSWWAAWELVESGKVGMVTLNDAELSYNLFLAWNRPGMEPLSAGAFRTFLMDEKNLVNTFCKPFPGTVPGD